MEDARIKDLEDQVAELKLLVERLATVAPAVTQDSADAIVEATATEPAVASRRGMLKLAGAAAAGAVVVAVAGNASPAAATDGDPMTLGASNSAATTTSLIGRFGALADSSTAYALNPVPAQSLPGYGGTVYGFNTSVATDGNVRGGVLGISSPFIFTSNLQTGHGVVGYASGDENAGSGVYGVTTSTRTNSAGLVAKANGGPSIQMIPVATGAPTTGAWTVGALRPDTTGNLWYCIASGTPGTWKNLSASTSQYFPISPVRVYDSRVPLPAPGVLSTGANRTISVASGRALDTGNINAADVVPAGATAITCNVTVDKTQTAGYLTVNPGGNTTVTSSTINWFGNGQTLANGVTVTISASREVTVIAGGPGATDFVLDVTGYFR